MKKNEVLIGLKGNQSLQITNPTPNDQSPIIKSFQHWSPL